MMAHKGISSTIAALTLVSIFVAAHPGSVQAGPTKVLDTGITVRIHSASEIMADPATAGIELDAADRVWFPFDETQVMTALAGMNGFSTSLKVNVYILPAPPAAVGSSYASGSAIYLSPGTGPVDPSTVAYIATHEMGHVLTSAFLDGSAARWDAYMALRGLDPVTNGPSAIHADRAREIIAEDFRFLFGGSLATVNASIENHELTLPDRVAGLEDLLVSFVASEAPRAATVTATAFPNPCNPRTTVVLNLPAGLVAAPGNARLHIFDLRGALIRTVTGGDFSGDQILIRWDGDSDQGRSVASGRYLYVIQAGSLQAKGAVTLVR